MSHKGIDTPLIGLFQWDDMIEGDIEEKLSALPALQPRGLKSQLAFPRSGKIILAGVKSFVGRIATFTYTVKKKTPDVSTCVRNP
ncbi:hypothetical protein TNIN_454611 [Trichonephila inaurata madagascariensis]|uniref:Uncharacterized protein n=1 Tax=Trichonephila inaurata madagascariensis TaxID=2747483 RepID=A0A8X6YR89_9ARAC|nr:hypothetical protein TNIN_454611 [Trichonephila inaurata madagascariensis]